MSHVLLPYVHGNQSSPELGPPRLRQVRLQEGELETGSVLFTLFLPLQPAAELFDLCLTFVLFFSFLSLPFYN